MIGKKFLGLVTLLVAMLAIFGCEDFESGEFGYDITFKSTWCNIVKINEDNTALVEVRSLIVVDTLYNETLENSVIELGDEEQRPTIKKLSDSEYLFTAQFDNVPLGETKYVRTLVRGTVMKVYGPDLDVFFSWDKAVKIVGVKQMLEAPDSVVLQVQLDEYSYMDAGGTFGLEVQEPNSSFPKRYTFSPKDIRNGMVEVGFHPEVSEGTYTYEVKGARNALSCSVNIPKSTATISNFKYELDVTGLHITADFNRGNLVCTPTIYVSGKNDNIILPLTSSSVDVHGIYPTYNETYTVGFSAKIAGWGQIIYDRSISVKSGFKRYGVDMGGDVLWALCNEGASDPFQKGDYKYRMDWEPDGDWRLPTYSELKELEQLSTIHREHKDNNWYLVVTEIDTGNSILLPTTEGEGCDYFLEGINRDYNTLYYSAFYYSQWYDRIRTEHETWGYARYVIPKNPNPMTGIQLDVHSLKFTRSGDKYDLNATILPSDATNTELRWSTDNADVAVVDVLGRVTSNNPGTCNITVSSAANSNVFAKCEVIVE